MHMNFLHEAKVIRVENSAVAGTSALVTDVIDMRGFSSIAFIAVLGDVTANSVLTLTGSTNDADSTSGATALTDVATFTAGASDADNKMLMLDLHQPRERYVFATLTRTAANAVVDGIIAVLYNPTEKPVTPDAGMIASAHVNDPA